MNIQTIIGISDIQSILQEFPTITFTCYSIGFGQILFFLRFPFETERIVYKMTVTYGRNNRLLFDWEINEPEHKQLEETELSLKEQEEIKNTLSQLKEKVKQHILGTIAQPQFRLLFLTSDVHIRFFGESLT